MSFTDAITPNQSGITRALKDNLAAVSKSADDMTAQSKAIISKKDEAVDKANKEEAGLDPNALNPPKIEPFQAPPSRDPAKAFGSFAGVLGALGGLLARRPLTTSLEAATKVMNAYQQQDAAAAQTAFDEWRVNADNALKLSNFELKSYQTALDKIDTDKRAAFADAAASTAAMQNENAATVLKTQGLEGFADYVLKMQTATNSFQKAKEDSAIFGLQMNGWLQWRKENPAPPATASPQERQDYVKKYQDMLIRTFQPAIAAADDRSRESKWVVLTDPVNNQQFRYNPETHEATTLKGEPYTPSGAQKMGAAGETLNQQKAALAQDIERASGMPDGPEKQTLLDSIDTKKKAIQEASFTGSMAGRSAATIAVNTYREKHPDASAGELVQFAAETRRVMAAQQAFGTGPQGNQVRFLSTVVDHISTLTDIYEQLNNGGVPAFNRLKNQIEAATGQPAPASFDAAKQIVGQEIVKAVVGSGAGGVTERQDAGERIRRDLSNAQFQAVRNTYYQLMGGQLRGLKRQYVSSTSLSPKFQEEQSDMNKQSGEYFDTLISDEAKKALDSAKGSGSSLPSGWKYLGKE